MSAHKGATNDELIVRAQQRYGALIDHIYKWPSGLGIDVHLIGGEVVQYFPDSHKPYPVNGPSIVTKASRLMANIFGTVRRLFRGLNPRKR